MRSNTILADWAQQALARYIEVSDGCLIDEAMIPLVIASLLHRARQFGLDPQKVLAEAQTMFVNEEANEG